MGSDALHSLIRQSPDRFVRCGMVVLVVANAPPVLAGFAHEASLVAWVAMLLATAGLAAGLGRWATRARLASGVLARICLGGGVAGWLNSVLCFFLWRSLSPEIGGGVTEALSQVPVVAIVGGLIGGPIGFANGLVLLVPALIAHRLRRPAGPALVDVGLAAASLWIAAAVIPVLVLAVRMPRANPLPATPELLSAVLAAPALGGAGAVLLLVVYRLWRRQRWLGRVRAGLVENWVVVPRDTWPASELDGVTPLLANPWSDAVLASVTGENDYRRARRLNPRALVADRVRVVVAARELA